MFDGPYLEWNNKRIKAIIDNYGHQFFAHKKILDLGCGHADISGVLYRLGGDVTAVDARQEHLKLVEKKYSGIKLVKADLDRGWPFFGRTFDLTLDLALLCHLNNYEEHLKAVISSTEYLILETAVVNSDNDNLCTVKTDHKTNYDESANGTQTQVTAAAIERVLSECGMNFKRMDNTKLNCGSYRYDWLCDNSSTFDMNQRRLWFCQKNTKGVITYSFKHLGESVNLNSNVPVSQQPSSIPVSVVSNPAPHEPTSIISNDLPPLAINSDSLQHVQQETKNIRVLYLPLGAQTGTVEAFREAGVELSVFDYWTTWQNIKDANRIKENLLNIVRDFRPHLIHMQLQFTGIIDATTLHKVREIVPSVIITNWTGDVRKSAPPQFTSLANVVDYSLISSTGQLDLYRNAGCKNVRYWQIGYDPKFSFPMHLQNFKYDISFIANNYGNMFPDGQLRLNTANQLRSTFGAKFGLFGSGYKPNAPTIDPSQANNVYNESVCALSISNFNNISHYFSDRLLYCLASGRPTITWHFPGVEDYFIDGQEIFVARSTAEIIDIVKRCRDNPSMANQVGINGYKKALKEHTFTSRVIELLKMTNLIHTVEHDKIIL